VSVEGMLTSTIYNSEGLPISILSAPDSDGMPSFDLYYAICSVTSVDDETIPAVQNLRVWPNPTRHEATLSFPTKASGQVNLRTYNIRGQLVKEETCMVDAANYALAWLANDGGGRPLNSGIYLIRAQGDGFVHTAKVLVLKYLKSGSL
ncbi:MAG: T9SS type A sorting domain-containing protein, partial [Candidatus Cloacimonadaceae bacterium]|nr:T9SS type A sorting domain-containing protein [Candidatus Cloacimonadaceae bacterium]